MAISFVAAATGSASSGTTVTVTKPAGTVDGDVLFAAVHQYASAGASGSFVTAPAGWTRITDQSSAGNGGDRISLFYRVASGEGSSYAFGCSSGDNVAAAVLAYRGVDTTTPIEGKFSASAAGTAHEAPALTTGTTKDGCQILRVAGTNIVGSYSPPSGYTERVDYGPANTGTITVADALQAAAGAVGTATFTGPNAAFAETATVALRNGNVAPNAPTLAGPASNATVDRTVTQRFSWTFSDPDAGDSQSAYDVQYRVGTGAWTTVSGSTPNQYRDFASGTFASGSTYEWQVRCYDSQGVVGPWSASSFFTAATPPATPSITAPTSGGTVSSTAAVTWSAPSQTDYQVRRVADNAGTADTGTVYYDTGDVVDAASRALTLSFPVNNRWEHVQVRVKSGGLWSAWADVRVLVSFTPPATPTLSVTADNATASILVQVTNPAPGAGVPAVSYNDLYVREVGDSGAGMRLATGVGNNGTFTWWTPASGVDYEFQVVAVATNGTTSETKFHIFPAADLYPSSSVYPR